MSKFHLKKESRQTVLLYASTLFGVLLGVLISVINTTSLPPEMYGDVRYVQNVIAFISSLLLLGYFTSGSRLLALSDDEKRSRMIRGGMVIILGLTIFILMLCLFALYLYNVFKERPIASLYAVAIPLCGNILMLNYVNTTAQGDNHINRIAVARILPSLVYICLALVVYRYCKVTVTSELMLVLYNGTAIMVLAAVIFSTHPSFSQRKESLKVLNDENRAYGFNVYLGALFGVSTQYIAGITLGLFCENNANVGFYTLALTVATPLAMLPSIIGTIHFKHFATDNEIDKKVFFNSLTLTVLSCIVFCLLINYIVELLYDSSYKSVGIYAQWLSVGMCCHGLGDMINRFLGAHGQGVYIRNSAMVCGISIFIGSFVLVYFFQIAGAICTKLIGSVIYLGMLLFYYCKYVKSVK